MYNLTCTDKYGPPPENLDELCNYNQKEESGTCIGSLYIFIFFNVRLCMFISRKKEMEAINMKIQKQFLIFL